MMGGRKALALIVAIVIAATALAGCQKAEEQRFAGYKEVAELATETCYYHNVAEIINPGDDYLFGLVNVGYKKAWFEYRGSVNIGIDVSKVKVSPPDANNVVTIEMPPAKVIGQPTVDKGSFSEIYADTGIFTQLNLKDKTEAYQIAQTKMKETAESDTSLLLRARERAKTLLSQYVSNVGKAKGESYELKFVDVD